MSIPILLTSTHPMTLGPVRKSQPDIPSKQMENDDARLKTEVEQLKLKNQQWESEKAKLIKQNEHLNLKYESFCHKASEQLENADSRCKAAENARQLWQLKARKIAEELAKCKDELFSLQPRGEVTDSQIATEWDALCQQIARWVDDEAEFDGPDLFTRLKELRDHNQLSPTIQNYWGKDRQLLVNRFKMNEDLDCILRYDIHCLLEAWVFDDAIYLFGLNKEDTRLLSTIEQSLANLKPPRDQGRIDHWRSEALNAMLGLSAFKEVQGERATQVTREAESFIRPLLPTLGAEAMKRFHSQITLPAISLACSFRRSPVRYFLRYDLGPSVRSSQRPALAPQRKGRAINIAQRHEVDLLDVDSRKTLKANQGLAVARDGTLGEEILIIHPALSRRKGDAEEIMLRKTLELIKLLAPLPSKTTKDRSDDSTKPPPVS
ncbi:hypothetical protein MMC13_002278 [Lambiella insularis]|nr:hypothetical protein [Lambiella insularis]